MNMRHCRDSGENPNIKLLDHSLIKKSTSAISELTPAQCRAARSLVDMTQIDLANAASVTKNVIIDFEKGRRVPTRNNLAAIQRVLEAAGVEFIYEDGGGPGVRLRKKKR